MTKNGRMQIAAIWATVPEPTVIIGDEMANPIQHITWARLRAEIA